MSFRSRTLSGRLGAELSGRRPKTFCIHRSPSSMSNHDICRARLWMPIGLPLEVRFDVNCVEAMACVSGFLAPCQPANGFLVRTDVLHVTMFHQQYSSILDIRTRTTTLLRHPFRCCMRQQQSLHSNENDYSSTAQPPRLLRFSAEKKTFSTGCRLTGVIQTRVLPNRKQLWHLIRPGCSYRCHPPNTFRSRRARPPKMERFGIPAKFGGARVGAYVARRAQTADPRPRSTPPTRTRKGSCPDAINLADI